MEHQSELALRDQDYERRVEIAVREALATTSPTSGGDTSPDGGSELRERVTELQLQVKREQSYFKQVHLQICKFSATSANFLGNNKSWVKVT